MKTRTQQGLFWALIGAGTLLPWLTVLASALVSNTPVAAAFRPLTAVLPLLPVSLVLLAAWWTLPFVVFAFFWLRLATAEWEPLRRYPLLILLGIPVPMSAMGAFESLGAALYLLAFLVYAMIAIPSWGLRSRVGRIVFSLFGFMAILVFTLLNYGFFFYLGANDLRQFLAAPIGILGYMSSALLVGYLFAKPIDLLVSRSEPVPEPSSTPKPSARLIVGNAAASAAGLYGSIVLYSRLAGSAVTRHEIGLSLADEPLNLAFCGAGAGVILGVAAYVLVLVLLRKGAYPRGNPVLDFGLALLPGLLLGLTPVLLGQRAVFRLAQSDFFAMYSRYGAPSIESFAASPDGSRIAADSDSTLVTWHTGTGRPLLRVEYDRSGMWMPASGLSWSPDGSRIAVALPSDGVSILDSRTGHRLLTLKHPDGRLPESDGARREAGPWTIRDVNIVGTAFSPDGARLAAARADGEISVFTLADGALQHAWPSPVPPINLTAIAISPNGRQLAVAGISSSEGNPTGGFLAVIDASSGETRYARDDFEQIPSQLTYSPDGSRLLLAGTGFAPHLVDAATGSSVVTARHHCSVPKPAPYSSTSHYATFLAGGRTIVAACPTGVVDLCDATSGECRLLFELQLMRIDGLAAHPSGSQFLLLENRSVVALWDALDAEPRQIYRLP